MAQLKKKKRIVIHAITNTEWFVEDPQTKKRYGPYSPKQSLWVKERLENGMSINRSSEDESVVKEEDTKEDNNSEI